MTQVSQYRDGAVPEWLIFEPPIETDGDGQVTNAGQRYGSTRGRTGGMIRAAIDAARMSQNDVARAIRITPSNLSLILSGEMLPSLRTVAELSALLRVPLESLIDLEEVRVRGEEARSGRSAKRTEVERAKRSATPKKRR